MILVLTTRRSIVLKAIIDEFIHTAHPVGSKLLIQKYDMPYSSATIRNEMAMLEELGLLEKTHTSSGRVPSLSGYRFYINHFLDITDDVQEVTDDEVDVAVQIERIVKRRDIAFDEKIQLLLRVLSDETGLTAIFIGPSARRNTIVQVRMLRVSANQAAVLVVTDQGQIETRLFQLATMYEFEMLDNTIKFLNQMLNCVPLNEVFDKLENDIKPLLEDYIDHYDQIHDAILQFFSEMNTSITYFSGQANLLLQSEFDRNTIKAMFEFLEDDARLSSLKQNETGIDIRIGSEIGDVCFEECALISTTFRMPIRGHGTIAILGPIRLDYQKVAELLNIVGKTITI